MSETLLQINNISVVYSDVIQVLKGVSLALPEGQIVSLLGSNGAGKTTTLKAISGLLRTEEGEVTDGGVYYEGKPIHKFYPEDIARMGILQVMEGRRLAEHLTVEENLRAGGLIIPKNGTRFKKDLEMVYGYFPRLVGIKDNTAGYCSGGEQQMIAMGRCLMGHPKIMLLDEPSMGLAPVFVEKSFELIQDLNRRGIAILLVEQNANMALAIANRGYVLQNGHIVLQDTAQNLINHPMMRKAYLEL